MRYLQRIDTPDIQPDAEFILDGLNMPEKMLIASGQNADHAEVGRFEERDEVPSNVAPLCLDIIGNDDVIDRQCAAHTAYVPPGKIGHHSPVVSIGHRTQTQFLHGKVKRVTAVTST